MSDRIILKNVRGSYVFITTGRPDDNGVIKRSMQVIIDKNDPQVKKLNAEIAKVCKSKFPDVKQSMLKLPLRDGDTERDEPSYDGCYFFNTSNAKTVGIVNQRVEPASQEDMDEYLYSGAYFNVSIRFYGFEHKGKKGVAVSILNVMLHKHGDRLDGGMSASDEFAALASEFDDEFEDDIPY